MKKSLKRLALNLIKKHALYRMPLSSELANISSYYQDYYANVNHNPIENGEYWLLDLVASQDGDIIDVGAFIGEYSKYFLARSHSGCVIAVEPSIESYSTLCDNLRAFMQDTSRQSPRLLPINCAASSQDGDLEYFYSSEHPNGSTLNHAFATQPEFVKKSEFSLRIAQARSLDNIITNSGLQLEAIALLKIDAEGHEVDVLKGACNLLKTVGIVQIEYGMHNLYKRWLLQDVYRELGSRFHIGRLYPKSILISSEYNPDWEDFKGRNLVLINKSQNAHPCAEFLLRNTNAICWS
jgi:FkbM family methyltransferase